MSTATPITFPCLHVTMVSASKVVANDYNPNSVAPTEMDLLALSIQEDGVTQPVVVVYNDLTDLFEVVDGFHRYTVLTKRFQCEEIPVVVLSRSIGDRMAATIRHNRARGKHRVDLMSEIVGRLLRLGWEDEAIAKHLGMPAEEVIRLKTLTGLAALFKGQSYSKAWERCDG